MIRYITLLTVSLLLTVACSGGSDTNTAQVAPLTPTATVIPSTPMATNQPATKSSSVKKSTALDLGPKISCALNKEANQITCVSTNVKEGSQLKWTSTASDTYSGGGKWQFTISKQPIGNVEQVFLEICEGSICQTFETSIDTSELASVSTQKNITPEPTSPSKNPTPKKTPSASPVLNLPFTTDHEPVGMMPMGETILHPATPDNPNGHPGIDFQWPFRAEVIAATNGEVAEIRTSKPHGSLLYSVFVISGDFVVAYDVVDIYSVNPDLVVGSEVMSGQVMGYAESIGSGDGWTSMHWSFGKWLPGSEKPNPEGVVEKIRIDYQCPVPYFSETERLRLFRLWDIAIYPDGGGFKGKELKKQFPDVCNGPYKNY
jgi:hypothetical protein